MNAFYLINNYNYSKRLLPVEDGTIMPLFVKAVTLCEGAVSDARMPRHPINPFSAGTVFIRQNLTSMDVRF